MNDEKNNARKAAIKKQVEIARLSILEHALVAFVEDVDNRVPNDDEILAEGRHIGFPDNPLGIFEVDEKKFHQYFLWRREHVVAIGFLDENNLLDLHIVRVPEDQWPFALTCMVRLIRTGEA